MPVAICNRTELDALPDTVQLSLVEDGQAERAALDAWVRRHPQGSPYHLGAWRAAVAEAYGFPAKLVLAYRGPELAGMLPLCVIKRPFGRPRWSALPFCDLGGPLADSPGLAGLMNAHAAQAAAHAGASGFEARSSASALPGDADLAGRKVRMLRALPDSAAALMQSYPPKLRSQIRKAEKNGLVAAVETGPAAVAAFYQVYSRNMRRLGSPPHSLAWFEAIERHYGDDAFVMVVRHQGQAAGAGIVLLNGERAAIPWASTLTEYNALAPNMLLYWAIQARLCESGVREFDFGRSTYGEGTYKFKQQWGALPHALDWQEWDAEGRLRIPDSGAAGAGGSLRPLVEHVWQKLPLALTNSLGPRLRRYITL